MSELEIIKLAAKDIVVSFHKFDVLNWDRARWESEISDLETDIKYSDLTKHEMTEIYS